MSGDRPEKQHRLQRADSDSAAADDKAVAGAVTAITMPSPEALKAAGIVKRVVGRPFRKGESGNPLGPKIAGDRDTLSFALKKKLSPSVATKLAEKLIELALEGNLRAAEIVWDRAVGKPVQPVVERSQREIVVRIERA